MDGDLHRAAIVPSGPLRHCPVKIPKIIFLKSRGKPRTLVSDGDAQAEHHKKDDQAAQYPQYRAHRL